MTKLEKTMNNLEVEKAWEIARNELQHDSSHNVWERLRTCKAWVYETENYYFLTSYNTLVAFIVKTTDTCYDVLRLVYGYTSTSAQHIAKFRHDYGSGKFGCEHELRWYS